MENLTDIKIEELADAAVLKMFEGANDFKLANTSYRDGFIDGVKALLYLVSLEKNK